jgi:hypothetical protein
VEVNESYKHSSLLPYSNNYGCEKSYRTGASSHEEVNVADFNMPNLRFCSVKLTLLIDNLGVGFTGIIRLMNEPFLQKIQ